MVLALDIFWLFAWIANRIGWNLHGKGYQCMGREARRLQSVRAHARCVGPQKVRGLRYECAGRQVRGRARNAWAAFQLHGPLWVCGPHWVRGPQLRGEVSGPHCPRTSPAPAMQLPTQCNHSFTRLGRDESQSPGMLRVKISAVRCVKAVVVFAEIACTLRVYISW